MFTGPENYLYEGGSFSMFPTLNREPQSMSWSSEAWKRIEHVYEKIIQMDFVRQLGDGSLDTETFIRYIEQDKLYLDEYSRALGMIAVRTPDMSDAADFHQFSLNTAIAEQELHSFYLWHFKTPMRKDVTKSPTCELYTGFLAKHANFSSVEVAAAAVLPCFWIYDAVGKHHSSLLAQTKNHPYEKWISMYDSSDFSADVQKAIKFCDKLAAEATPKVREKMFEVFEKGCVLEYMFWQSAYDKEQWPFPI